MANDPIVWVLGAGFSRSLGGPLLRDLFSGPSAKNLATRFPSRACPTLASPQASRARWLYEFGLGPDRPRSSRSQYEHDGERLWADAEEYMEYLDVAAADPDSPLAVRLEQLLDGVGARELDPPRVPPIALASKNVMAAECSSFLMKQTTAFERWRPYVRWATTVISPDDCVISFNYDRVLETLAREHPSKTNAWGILVPGSDAGACAPVLKLHGSVDWAIRDGQVVVSDDEYFAVRCANLDEMVLGTPGHNKLRITERLEPLWAKAENALRNASAVVFLGYRFPPTDAVARERLLGAIGENERGAVIRTALGDDIRAAARIEALADYAVRTGAKKDARLSVTPEPLNVEDFLAVCSRRAIFTRAVAMK